MKYNAINNAQKYRNATDNAKSINTNVDAAGHRVTRYAQKHSPEFFVGLSVLRPTIETFIGRSPGTKVYACHIATF
jgi:hypothetical protein